MLRPQSPDVSATDDGPRRVKCTVRETVREEGHRVGLPVGLPAGVCVPVRWGRGYVRRMVLVVVGECGF